MSNVTSSPRLRLGTSASLTLLLNKCGVQPYTYHCWGPFALRGLHKRIIFPTSVNNSLTTCLLQVPRLPLVAPFTLVSRVQLKGFFCDHVLTMLHSVQGIIPKKQPAASSNARPRVAGTRRITTPHACTECKRRKIRCDGKLPCGQCITSRAPKSCSYDKHRQRMIPSRKYVICQSSAKALS